MAKLRAFAEINIGTNMVMRQEKFLEDWVLCEADFFQLIVGEVKMGKIDITAKRDCSQLVQIKLKYRELSIVLEVNGYQLVVVGLEMD
jgi:hypothetical protein